MKKGRFVPLLGFMILIYSHVQACEEGYVKGVNTGNCIKAMDTCGNGCTYTIDDKGNVEISGTGMVPTRGVFYKNKDIKNVTISDGIWAIGEHAFCESSLESVHIPTSVTKIWGAAFASTNLKELIIPDSANAPGWGICENCKNLEYLYLPNKATGDWYNGVSGTNKLTFVLPPQVKPYSSNPQIISASLGNIYCTGEQIEKGFCASDVNRYEQDGGNYIVYNSDGTIKDILHDFHDFTSIVRDGFEEKTFEIGNDGSIMQIGENGILAKYDAHGNLMYTYEYNSDGSAKYYDAHGKLIGFKNKRIYTVDEAMMVVSGKNTFKLKYR